MTEEMRSSTHRETIRSAASQMAMPTPTRTRTRSGIYPLMRSCNSLGFGDARQILKRIFNTWSTLYCIVAVASLLVLYGLTRSPVVGDDEVFFADPARTLANSGSLATTILFSIGGFNQHFFIQPPVYFLLMAGAYRVFGFSETVARLGSAIPYIATIATSFFLARSISRNIGLGSRHASAAGLLGAFLIAFNSQSTTMARSGRPDWLAVLLLFLGWTIVARVRQESAHRLVRLAAGFSLMELAGLTYPVLVVPAIGIFLATTFWSTRFGISRQVALVAGLLSAGLIALPYGVWILQDFNEWRIQLPDAASTAASLRYGSFLSYQVQNVALTFRYQPAIVLLIIIGTAAFPWRRSPDVAGALVGMSIATALSSDSYLKFWISIALIPSVAGLACLATKLKGVYRWCAAALIVLGLLNGFMFPIVRAYAIHQSYPQRDPMLVTDNIERFVPHGAHLMGIPAVYYAAISDDAEFRYFRLLWGVRWTGPKDVQSQFRRDVENYKPTWFALLPGIDPQREYCYLHVRFRRVSTVNTRVSSGLDVAGQRSIAYTLWTTSPGASPGC